MKKLIFLKLKIFSALFLLSFFHCGNEDLPPAMMDPPKMDPPKMDPPMDIHPSRKEILCGKDPQCLSLATLYLDNVKSEQNIKSWMKSNSYCTWPGVTCDLQGHVIELNLDGGIERDQKLTVLSPSVFSGLPYLETLDLSFNPQLPIHENAFLGLTNLKDLSIVGCDLTELPDFVFAPLGSLQKLDLQNNHIFKLSANTLAGLSHLQKLEFRGNELQQLDRDALSSLTELVGLGLSANQIVQLPWGFFKWNKKLQVLDLQSNSISSLDQKDLSLSLGSVLDPLTELRELYLTRNNLTAIKGYWFTSLKKLEHLRLEVNLIQTMDKDAFATLTELQGLYLTDNFLGADSFPADVFKNNTKLFYLSLDSNQFGTNHKTIPADWFAKLGPLENLGTLGLSNNHLTSLNSKTFSSLKNLHYLGLSSNELKDLGDPSIFGGLGNLEYLDLSENQIEKLSKTSVFSKLVGLQSLVLYANPIATIEKNAFSGLSALTSLNLSETSLTELTKENLEDLSVLETLWFYDQKKLTTIASDTFAALLQLQQINVSEDPNLVWTIPMDLCSRMPPVQIDTLHSPGIIPCMP